MGFLSYWARCRIRQVAFTRFWGRKVMAGNLSVVTGAHGFLGRHAARHLSRQGWDVIGLGHGSWPHSEWRAWGLGEWHACDVTLETLLVYGKETELIGDCAGS